MAARIGLTVANLASTTTFRRPGYTHTIPDVTFVSDTAIWRVTDWRVSEEYNGSDHQYIYINIEDGRLNIRGPIIRARGWNVNKINVDALALVMQQEEDDILAGEGQAEEIVKDTMELIRRAFDAAMPRRTRTRKDNKKVYWWSDEIADLRKSCLRARRVAIMKLCHLAVPESVSPDLRVFFVSSCQEVS